jgi:hypothetical protein
VQAGPKEAPPQHEKRGAFASPPSLRTCKCCHRPPNITCAQSKPQSPVKCINGTIAPRSGSRSQARLRQASLDSVHRQLADLSDPRPVVARQQAVSRLADPPHREIGQAARSKRGITNTLAHYQPDRQPESTKPRPHDAGRLRPPTGDPAKEGSSQDHTIT